ncbi:hypothetical protein ACXET9_07450 [Brachybacterium sp. DNPG3]
MTTPAVPDALDPLRGQWVEAVDPAPRPTLVLSGAAVLRGDLRIPGGAPLRDDARMLGAVVSAIALDADATLTLLLADADGGRPMPLTITAPWSLALPDGARLAADADADADADARISARPGDPAPRVATTEAMATWADASPDEVELAVLEAALDDWVTPADAVSELVEREVHDPREIARRGTTTLARLVARGNLEPGSIGEHGFVPAADDAAASIEHMAVLWSALGGIGRMPGPGQITWFRLTEQGRSRLAEKG